MKRMAAIFLGLLLVNLILTAWSLLQKPKLAFVRSQDLVYGYLGTKEAQNKFEEKRKAWQQTIDTLKSSYLEAIKTYNLEVVRLSSKEKSERQNHLQQLERDAVKYAETVTSLSKEEENRMLEGVFNQINNFVKEYGTQNGYDIIFGTTQSGSLLYGRDVIDITDELITELNRTY